MLSLRSTLACLTFSWVSVAAVLAHSDDAKVRDRQPPYRGPGYRAILRDALPSFPSSGVTLMSWLPLQEFGTQHTSGNSCWGYVSPSGREYAIMGLSHGTAFVEVTDPADARVVAVLSGPAGLWRDVKAFGEYAYSVSESGSGIQVFDLRQIDDGTVSFVRNVTTGGATATHTLVLNPQSGHLYRCGGGSNGLRMYSLATPDNPTLVGSWSSRYVHEAQVVSYSSGPYAGREIAFCCGGLNTGFSETGLYIVDVTNKAAPVQLSYVNWPMAAYSHQVWLSEDRRYAYINDELDEQNFGNTTRTLIIDVQDLAAPVLAGQYSNGSTAVDHNHYVIGDRIVQSSYRSGLRIFDISNPTAPTEIGYFDTWPQDDLPNFNGLWNNYPFLPSGTILGSDIEKGLFVWRLPGSGLSFTYPSALPQQINPAGQTIDVSINVQGASVPIASSARMLLDSGAGYASIPLVNVSGNLYRATFPPIACGRTLRFYFEADTSDSLTWRDPPSAPQRSYEALAAYGSSVLLSDDLETNTGWTVGSAQDFGVGAWLRGNPPGNLAEPADDHSPIGITCFYTGVSSDVSGRTTLTTPTYDLSSAAEARIRYWRWYSNSSDVFSINDTFTIEISNNNGTSWALVERIGTGFDSSGGWISHEFRVADIVPPSAQIRLRFVATDLGSPSVVEAAIDDLSVLVPDCVAPCPGDLNGDRSVDESDLGALLAAWQAGSGGDLDADGDTDESDLGLLLANWLNVCP